MRSVVSAAAAALAFVGIGEAATVDLSNVSFSDSSISVVDTFTDTNGDQIKLVMAPFLFNSDGQGGYNFTQTYGMTGYSGGVGINRRNDAHVIDGEGTPEAIVIQAQNSTANTLFDIRLTSITFGYFDQADDFTLFAGTGGIATLDLVLDDVSIWGANPSLLSVVGSTFAIGADHHSDSFKLKAFTYDLLPSIDTAVPLPAALPMFLAGFAGITVLRRRKA